ncbi:MAG: PcfJ domain-containing protein [Myxococcales bacterium]|nr:PcfJ domain-containing protein [Myxococcales bacterium]
MTRRNRRKVHQELRLRAEAHKAQLRARREAKRRREEALQSAIHKALRRRTPKRRSPQGQVPVALTTSVDQLLALANVSPYLRGRVRRVLRAVVSEIPAMAASSSLPWLLLLSMQPWVRPPERFTAPSGSTRAKRDALARHLLVRFRVPPFLLSALDFEPLAVARVPLEDAWGVEILATLGRGASLRSLVGTPTLPAPLTRRMCHLLQTATADQSVIGALRHAQVVGFGGPKQLARMLLATRLGTPRGSDPRIGEAFWHRIIGWLAVRPEVAELRLDELRRVLGWFESQQRKGMQKGVPIRLTGRTPASVVRAANAWWDQTRQTSDEAFPRSGLLPLSNSPQARAQGNGSATESRGIPDLTFRMVEVSSEAELRAAADVMRNCAFSYRKLLRKGKVALFVLHRGERPVAMIEVSLGAMAVVQAKQPCNRTCSSQQLAAVRRWAVHNRLLVKL